jgi:effector-binding domain-containing protein
MWIILGLLAALVLAVLIYLATLEGGFQVRRSLEVAAPPEAVFAAIIDFKTWPAWSPWLMHEPDAAIVYSENHQDEGGYYSWDGKIVGAGKLTHVGIHPGKAIAQEIEFLRPFKSRNQVNWAFENRDGNTLVSWEMAGRMPFLFRFMAKQMEPMIGRDYELGLALLNGYLNADAPHPGIAFVGAEELQDFIYWAIPFSGNLRQLETARHTNIEALQSSAGGNAGLALTLYHQFEPKASNYQAEIAVPISDRTPLSNYKRREFKGGRYFKMTLHGDHQFLPLGWHALSSHCRMHKIRFDKTRPALEIYHDDPQRVEDSNQVLTALYLPIT